MAVISKLPRGATEKEEPAVMVTIYGGALETITSDGAEICTTDANGEGTAVLNVGQTYTLIGGVSGYEKTVKIASDTESIKVMPEGAVYWYGNECTDITGGINYRILSNNNKYSEVYATVNNAIDLSRYSKAVVVFKTSPSYSQRAKFVPTNTILASTEVANNTIDILSVTSSFSDMVKVFNSDSTSYDFTKKTDGALHMNIYQDSYNNYSLYLYSLYFE